MTIFIADMMQAAKSSNHMVTNVSSVKYIFNIREWILAHLDTIRYHTEQYIRKIELIKLQCTTKHGLIVIGSPQTKATYF